MDDRARAVPFETAEQIDAALPGIVRHLRAQRVLAYPTETVYGFGSSVMHEAITRVARLKGATPQRAFIALIAAEDMLEALDVRLSGPAQALAAAFWPGPLTLLVENARRVRTGIRWTPHPGAQSIIRAFGAPITSTSANRTGLPPATTAEEIVAEWERDVRDGILMVLDGGAPVIGTPSTIVDCTVDPPCVTRRGVIETEKLREVVPGLG